MSANKPATPLPWGAFDANGILRARFESESEAHFYVRNRGHMFAGSYRKIDDAYPRLVAALRTALHGMDEDHPVTASMIALLRELGESE